MSSKKKIDYKKEFPLLYNPPKEPTIIDIPKMKFFMLDGKGNPNTSQEYQNAMQALYGAAFTLKMSVIKKETGKDYVVPPLEGLWFMEKMEKWSMDNKDDWEWTMMIRIPDFVKDEQIDKALKILKEKKDPISFAKLYIKEYHEKTVVQQLYIGPYAEEGPTIAKMHDYAKKEGYVLAGKHHEIYISDPRRTKPEKLKTVIRQPIK